MRLLELYNLQPFKTDEYNTPNQMEIMANPDYWREKKGVVGGVEWMTPTQYIRACELGFRRNGEPGLVRQGRNEKLIKQYANDMKRGDKFPMLELDYRDNYFGQEGLHRAMAAESIKVKKVPVFIMKDSPEKMSEAAIKIGGKKNPNVEKFMDTLYKVTQEHPFDPSQRIAWDGKSTIEARPMGDHINISAIQTLAPKERSGSASALIATAVQIANETGVTLRLSAIPFGTTSGKLNRRQLMAWYKRKGFVPDPTSGAGGMTYTPPTKESITEGLSPVLYHYTSISNALDIVTQNQFKLAASTGTSSEAGLQSGGRMYFLSTTRHKMGGYHLENDMAGVIINLDGKKLGQRYKGKPVDYWGPDWYGVDRKGFEKREAEDRLFSTEQIIPNAKQYIQEIHLLFTARGQDWHEKTAPRVRRLLIAAKSTGIPIYFYEDAKAWLLQNKRKTVDPSKIEAVRKTSAKDIDQGRYYYDKKNEFSGWIELYHIDEVDKLSPATDRQYRYVMYYPQDAVTQLSNEIHNNKSDPESGLPSLMRIWRKLKIRTVKEYVEYLQKKWGKDEG